MPAAETLELTDPRAMRALAHPARLSILELLHANGTANATECARELGGSPQAASYHLRALAKWGLIARVDSTDGRETRWELAARAITFTEGEGSPQYRRAARALGRRVLERDDRIVADYIDAEPDESREWREAATLSSRRSRTPSRRRPTGRATSSDRAPACSSRSTIPTPKAG